MIALSTGSMLFSSPPITAGGGDTGGGANDFLLQLLSQLYDVEARTATASAFSGGPALPDVNLGMIAEPNMGTVTPRQVDEERHLLEQLLQRLQDLIAEGLGPLPQALDTTLTPLSLPTAYAEGSGEVLQLDHDATLPLVLPENSSEELPLPQQDSGDGAISKGAALFSLALLPLPRQDSGDGASLLQLRNAGAAPHSALTAPEQGNVFELPTASSTPRSFQQLETVSIPGAKLPAQPVLSSIMAPRSVEQAEAGVPGVASTVGGETPYGEKEFSERVVLGERDRHVTSQTVDTTVPQQLVHEESSLGNMTRTPSAAVSGTSVVPPVDAATTAAEPRIGADRADIVPISHLRMLTPLRSLSMPRNTVVLQVEPPELGTLVVQVRQVDEHFTASFWAESSDVRSLLQGHFPALNQALSQQGFDVAQLTLNMHLGQGFAGHSGGFSQQQSLPKGFSHGQSGEDYELRDASRRRFVTVATRVYGSGRVDITI